MGRLRTAIVLVVAVGAGVGGLVLGARTAEDAGTTELTRGAGTAPPSSEGPEVGATGQDPMTMGDPYWRRPALPPAPAPPGLEVVAFNDGGMPGLAGYIPDEGPHGWDQPDPPIDLGTGRYEVRGWSITDLDGTVLGYAVAGVGLVDLTIAADPEAMDSILAEAVARLGAEEGMTEAQLFETFGDPSDGEGG